LIYGALVKAINSHPEFNSRIFLWGSIYDIAVILNLLRDGIVGNVMEGIRPEHTRAAVYRGIQASLGRLIGPGVVRVVQGSSAACIQCFIKAGELADVHLLSFNASSRRMPFKAAEVFREGDV
jgi:hypothetical protein